MTDIQILIEILKVLFISACAGIVMVLSHTYLKMFFDSMHVVMSYIYGSVVNLAALLIAFCWVGKFDLARLILYFGAIWGCTGLLVTIAYTMDFAGKRVRRKALKANNNKGNGKRTD